MVSTMNKIIAKAQADTGFKEKLLANPVETLKAEGVELPPEVEKKVAENIEKLYDNIQAAGQAMLTDEELDLVTAGVGKDPSKPCKNSTCPYVYDSAECWFNWLASFTLCKSREFGTGIEFDSIHPDDGGF